MITQIGSRTITDAYNDLYAQIHEQYSIRGQLEEHGTHLIKHLEDAFLSLDKTSTASELEEAYEMEMENCGICD